MSAFRFQTGIARNASFYKPETKPFNYQPIGGKLEFVNENKALIWHNAGGTAYLTKRLENTMYKISVDT